MSTSWNASNLNTLGKLSGEVVAKMTKMSMFGKVVEGFFGALTDPTDLLNDIVTKLEDIQSSLTQISDKLDAITIATAMSNVINWAKAIDNWYDKMDLIVKNAVANGAENTKQDIANLVQEIEKDAFSNARSIKEAMIWTHDTSTAILELVYKEFINKRMDALDLYGAMKNFSFKYLFTCQRAAALLRFAAHSKHPADKVYKDEADIIDGYTDEWDKYLESGNNPLMSPMFTAWARLMISGAAGDPSKPMICTNMNWGVNGDSSISVMTAPVVMARSGQPQPNTDPNALFVITRSNGPAHGPWGPSYTFVSRARLKLNCDGGRINFQNIITQDQGDNRNEESSFFFIQLAENGWFYFLTHDNVVLNQGATQWNLGDGPNKQLQFRSTANDWKNNPGYQFCFKQV